MGSPEKALRGLFADALEIDDVGERTAFLARACGSDAALRNEIEELIQAEAAAGSFLPEQPAHQHAPVAFRQGAGSPGPAPGWPHLSITEKPGDLIGRYKLLEKVGEGGFGAVYLAEQKGPIRRQVALKVIKLGMDTKSVVARFDAERQALAMMDHVNIAKVLDAGATRSGRPFFVMEFVRGLKITGYCDQNQLTVRERLELFIQVCQAVQHAHQKGIIHRDLKPSNILVTVPDQVPILKVIDFGIAKATEGRLTDQTLITGLEQFLGTPAYMSPEQAALTSLDVDTRSDIYSLGVLLYELLSGSTPFDAMSLMATGLDELRQTILHKEPLRPSVRLQAMSQPDLTAVSRHRQSEPRRLISQVRGDLDWIVMKCLEKDRSRRYETANGLSNDLRRYLDLVPVIARPPSRVYLLTKLIRRQKLVFLAGGALFSALVLGAGFSTWQFIEKSRAAERARAAELEARIAKDEQTRLRGEAEATAARLAETLSQLELQRAEESFATGKGSEGLALLARVLRREPRNRTAAARLLSALAQRSFPPSLTDALRHNAEVRSVQFSADGQRIVTASRDNTARVWDALTGQARSEPLRHKKWVEWAQFSSDDRWLVTVSWDETAQVWNAVTGEPQGDPLRHLAEVNSARFSPDGRRVITASDDNTAQIWDVVACQPVGPALRHDAAVMCAVFSPDGARVVTASRDRTARVWDARTGEPVTPPLRHERWVRSAEFSADGQRVLTASWVIAQIWDATTGKPLTKPLQHEAGVNSARFNPEGSKVVTASDDNTAQIWDSLTGEPVGGPLGHQDEVWDARFSPDGMQVVTASRDKTVRVWSATTGLPMSDPICLWSEVRSVVFSPDGRRLAAVAGDQARVWDAQASRPWPPPLKHTAHIRSAAFSADGLSVVTGSDDKTARVWDGFTSRMISGPMAHSESVKAAEFHPSGQRVLTVADQVVSIWDVKTAQRVVPDLKHDMPISSAQFSPDGQKLVTAAGARVQVWDAQTGLPFNAPLKHDTRVLCARFTSDGNRVVTASEVALHYWSADTGRLLSVPRPFAGKVSLVESSRNGQRVLAVAENCAWVWDTSHEGAPIGPLKHESEIISARFSEDGERVITAAKDKRARIWSSTSGMPLTAPMRHEVWVLDGRFSPDGNRVVTVSMDQTARIWDARTGQVVTEPLRHDELINCARFSPDGQRLITGADDDTARIWEVPEVTLPAPDWAPGLAEAIAGMRLDAQGITQQVPFTELIMLKSQLTSSKDTDVWTKWAKNLFHPPVFATGP